MTSNMDMAAMLEVMGKYGRPKINQFAMSATPGIVSGGDWHCHVHVPIKDLRWQETGLPVTGWGFQGNDPTPTGAVRKCLDDLLVFVESDDAQHAVFASTEQVKHTDTIRKRRRHNASEV